MPAERCRASIEKEWPGHTAVLSRRQCRNRTRASHGYCHVHRSTGERLERRAAELYLTPDQLHGGFEEDQQ